MGSHLVMQREVCVIGTEMRYEVRYGIWASSDGDSNEGQIYYEMSPTDTYQTLECYQVMKLKSNG